MICVGITGQQRRWLEGVGHQRNSAKDPSWTRRKSDVFDDAGLDALGMLGEYAVCSYLGVPLNVEISRGGDDGHDLVWRDLKVAVKFNHRWRGYLMIEEREGDDVASGLLHDLTSDIVVLAHGKCDPQRSVCYCREPGGRVVVLAGWLWREEFVHFAQRRDLGLGGRYICKVAQLHAMHDLWDADARGERLVELLPAA